MNILQVLPTLGGKLKAEGVANILFLGFFTYAAKGTPQRKKVSKKKLKLIKFPIKVLPYITLFKIYSFREKNKLYLTLFFHTYAPTIVVQKRCNIIL